MNCPECGHSVFAHGPNGCYYDPNCACETTRKDISEHIETQLAALSWARWIPVAARLPENDEVVWVIYQGDLMDKAYRDKFGWFLLGNERVEPSHWMPLPPAPETEGTK